MSVYSIPTLVGAAFIFGLGSLVLLKNPRASNSRLFSMLCIFIFSWFGSYTIAYSITYAKTAVILCRIACTSVSFIATVLYHFIVNFLSLDEEKKYLRLAYLTNFAMLPFFIFTNYFLSGVYTYYWGYYSKAGIFHPIYLVINYIIFQYETECILHSIC